MPTTGPVISTSASVAARWAEKLTSVVTASSSSRALLQKCATGLSEIKLTAASGTPSRKNPPTASATWSSIQRVRRRDALWQRLHQSFDRDSMERRILRTHPRVREMLDVWLESDANQETERMSSCSSSSGGTSALLPEIPATAQSKIKEFLAKLELQLDSADSVSSRGNKALSATSGKNDNSTSARTGCDSWASSKIPSPACQSSLQRLQQQKQRVEADVSSLRFLYQRILSQDTLSRGPAKFPSTYLRLGPQFPFQPGTYYALMQRANALKGHELTKPIRLRTLDEKGNDLVPAPQDEAPGAAEADGEDPGQMVVDDDPWSRPQRAHKAVDPWRDGIFDQEDFLADRKRHYQY
ncbi:unnamed protein product [Amoebophrya sp. A120]|nr:unnamed protein product [Amoebophrya sp. A120]|eukprot:GSA120T00004307001.1